MLIYAAVDTQPVARASNNGDASDLDMLLPPTSLLIYTPPRPSEAALRSVSAGNISYNGLISLTKYFYITHWGPDPCYL